MDISEPLPADARHDLEARLARAERLLTALSLQTEQARLDAPRRRRRRTLVGVVLAVAALSWLRGEAPLAQGTPQTMIVKAPFKVVDDQGRTMLSVYGDGVQQGFAVFNAEGKVIAQVSTTPDGKGGMIVAKSAHGKGQVGFGLDERGDAMFKARSNDGRLRAEITGEHAQFNGPAIFGDRQGHPVMEVVATDDNVRGIMIRDAKRSPVAQITAMPDGGGAVMARGGGASAENASVAALRVRANGDPLLRLLSQGKPLAEIRKSTLTLNDSESHPVFVAGDKQEGTARGASIFGEGGKSAVTITGDQNGGSVRVLNPSGVTVGGLLGRETGGSMALTGPAGGESAISLAVREGGGAIRVFPRFGGSAQVEIAANVEGGSMSVYAPNGTPAGLLHSAKSGAGRLELGQGGQIYVEAGMLPSQLGIVRVGPGGRVGGMGIPGTFIMGTKGR